MSMKYRDRTEIVNLILRSSNTTQGTSKTRIMYQSFLAYSQLMEYLSLLMKNGLLEYTGSSRTYKTTERGVRLLQLCDKLHELIDLRETKKDQRSALTA